MLFPTWDQLQWLNGRASVFGTEGCGFESHLEYCSNQKIPGSNPGQDSCLVGPTVRRLTTE